MSNTFVLMTALPFHKGHEDLIIFADSLNPGSKTTVILALKEDEPFIEERSHAVSEFCDVNEILFRSVVNTHSEDPESDGFWDYWKCVYEMFAFKEGDLIVGSDLYIKDLARHLSAEFVYFGRETTPVSGTSIRQDPIENFSDMSEFMQIELKKTYVVFGAESVGKTTTTSMIADRTNGIAIPELARSYIQMHDLELNSRTMSMIVDMQLAQFDVYNSKKGIPFVWKDTDLFSTIGYYRLHPELVGSMNMNQLHDWAESCAADHYFILSSAIPFEEDPQRYGVDQRESPDSFWIDICKEFDLPYTYVRTGDLNTRLNLLHEHASGHLFPLSSYERKFND